jgi:tetratricopeptide (TPR) repeat protein
LSSKKRLLQGILGVESTKRKPQKTEDYSARSFQELYDEAIELYQKGIDGNSKSAIRAIEILEYLRSKSGGDNLLEAYYGASNILMGKYERNPMQKGKWTEKGLKAIDQAVNRDPHHTTIRILRGYSCYHLPGYLKRLGTAIEDFEYLLNRYQKEPGIISEQTSKRIASDLESAYKTKKKSIY